MFEGLRRFFSPGFTQHKAAEEVSEEAARMFAGISTGRAPPPRGSAELVRAYREIPALQQVVGRIAENFAAIQWTVHRAVDLPSGRSVRAKHLERMPTTRRVKVFRQLESSGELEEIFDDPFLDFLEAGNDVHTGFEVREVMSKHLELLGDAIAWKERNPLGMPIHLWPLNPTWVRHVPTPGESEYVVRIGSKEHHIPGSEIFHVRIPNPDNPYGRGAGIGQSLADELDTDEYAAAFVKAYFYNDARPSGIVAWDDATPEQLRELEARWMDKHRGAQKGHLVHFLTPKPDMVQMFGQSFSEMSTVELRKFLRSTFRETWGMPPEIVGVIENSNRATIEAAGFIFAQWLLVPRANRWQMALQKQIAPDFDERKIIGYHSPVPEDKTHTLEVAKAAPHTRTRGEWREMQGLEPNEGDDVYLQPPTMIEVPADGSAPPAPPPSAPSEGEERSPISITMKRAGVNPEDVEIILAELEPRTITAQTDLLWEDELRKWGDSVLANLGLGVSFDLLNPATVEHLREFGADRIDGINETTRSAIAEALTEGVEAGEGHAKLAKRVGEVFTAANDARAVLISRSEVARSANFGTWQSHVQSGVVEGREWVAINDDRVRETHLELDGEVVGLHEKFRFSDGAETYYPGDSGEVHHDANERCTTAAVVAGETAAQRIVSKYPGITETQAKAMIARGFVDDTASWERKSIAAFRRAFREQRARVLEALRKASERRGRL